MRIVRHTLVALFVLAPALTAQGDAPKSGEKKTMSEAEKRGRAAKLERRRAAIRERIQRERARMRQQKVVQTHVKVRVKLRNGERLQGIVKNGRFVERPSGGLEFSRAEMTMKDAGLRLWYYNNADGYIFLPYKSIKTYKVLKRLTDVEINVIRDEIKERERVSKAAAAQRLEKLKNKAASLKDGKNAAEKLDKIATDLAKKKVEDEENAKLLALVEEFPVSEGWGEERINKINIRRLTINVFPNAKERRFIEVFETWKKGRDLWLEKQKKEGKGAKSGDQAASSKSKGSKDDSKVGDGKSGSDASKGKTPTPSSKSGSKYGESGPQK